MEKIEKIEALKFLRDEFLKEVEQEDKLYALCSTVDEIYDEGLIEYDQKLFLEELLDKKAEENKFFWQQKDRFASLDEFAVFKHQTKINSQCFYWNPRKWKVRLKWINKQIYNVNKQNI